jgi:hypothetical protein
VLSCIFLRTLPSSTFDPDLTEHAAHAAFSLALAPPLGSGKRTLPTRP